MKKIVLLVVLVLLVASMSVLLFACSSKVAGKTYVLESVTVTREGATQEQIAQVKSGVESQYTGAKLVFNKDGTMVLSKDGQDVSTQYYVQDGKNIYIGSTAEVDTDRDPDGVVDGKNITITTSYGEYKINIVLVKE